MESTVKYAVKEEAQLKYPMLMRLKGTDCIILATNEIRLDCVCVEGTVVHSGIDYKVGYYNTWHKGNLEVFEGEVILKQ